MFKEQRSVLVEPTSEGLSQHISKQEELFSNVKTAREMALDTELFKVITETGVEQAGRLQMGYEKRDVGEFVQKLVNFFSSKPDQQNDNNNNNQQIISKEDFDWASVVKDEKYFKKAPTLQFMYVIQIDFRRCIFFWF